MSFELNGGVLIIGSLLWQDHTQTDKLGRENWRKRQLDLENKIFVRTPIRYGRLSSGNVYTMTFSNSCRGKKQGTGFVAPFKLNPISNFESLLVEVKELSRAEGMNSTFISTDRNGQIWCVLGILFNMKRIQTKDKKMTLDWWKEKIRASDNYNEFNSNKFKQGKEKPSVTQFGELNIPWPAAIDKECEERLDELSFLLATTTAPTGDRYPNSKTLEKSIAEDLKRKYFVNNRNNKITTFQDHKFENKLGK